MLATLSPFVLVAYASTAQILGGRGGIDISVGPLTTLVNCLLVTVLIPHGVGSPWLSLPLLLLVGAAAGFLNGLLVVVGRLQSVIATLATFSHLRRSRPEVLADSRLRRRELDL